MNRRQSNEKGPVGCAHDATPLFWVEHTALFERMFARSIVEGPAVMDDVGLRWVEVAARWIDLLGRVDDVMNISGHRMSTTEIESALVSHPKVAEAAVVGATDPTTGQAIVAFVILRSEAGDGGADVVQELRSHVAKEIGAIAKPRQIIVVEELPKTRSGKIMRRLLRDIAENREVGDVTTLTDSTVMNLIKENLNKPAASSEE